MGDETQKSESRKNDVEFDTFSSATLFVTTLATLLLKNICENRCGSCVMLISVLGERAGIWHLAGEKSTKHRFRAKKHDHTTV